jgi:hypothetical protein
MTEFQRAARLWQSLLKLTWEQYNERCRFVALGAEWGRDINVLRERSRKSMIAREYWMLACEPLPESMTENPCR